jgi:hypothetical protein
MFMQKEKPKGLKELLRDLIDTADVMLGLLRALGREDCFEKNITVKIVEAVMRYIVPKVMHQERQLEELLESAEPKAYSEWLMSVSPQSCVFQVRKEQAQARQARMTAAGL